MNEKAKYALSGIAAGIVNGLFGAGGGMIAVSLLRKSGLGVKESHVNAVAVILPITVISAVLYLLQGHIVLSDAIKFVPTGIIGSVIGTVALKKISALWLKRRSAAVWSFSEEKKTAPFCAIKSPLYFRFR